MVYTCRLSRLLVGLSASMCVWKVYCSETADWIQILFGVVSGVGMVVLDRGSDHRGERGSFGGEFGASHVINGDFVAWLCESDALFPNYFGEDFLCYSAHCLLHGIITEN